MIRAFASSTHLLLKMKTITTAFILSRVDIWIELLCPECICIDLRSTGRTANIGIRVAWIDQTILLPGDHGFHIGFGDTCTVATTFIRHRP